MIRTRRGLIAVGLLVLLLGLIVMFPARVAVHYFVPEVVALSGIQGSVWRGSASAASVDGIYCRDIRWEMNPLRLFSGEVAYRVSATPVSGFIEADLGFGVGGALNISNLSAALPLELIAGVSGLRGLQGSASLDFERITVLNGLATAADGELLLANLVVPIISRESLGGFKAEFFTQNNGITASVEDTDGVIDVAGSFQLKSDRTYQFTGQIVAKPETPSALREQMKFLPPPNSRGQQEIRLEGVL